jgi:hypothetical protein
VTAFVALLALDQRRVEAGRLDLAPCARLPALLSLARKASPAARSQHPHPAPSLTLSDQQLQGRVPWICTLLAAQNSAPRLQWRRRSCLPPGYIIRLM